MGKKVKPKKRLYKAIRTQLEILEDEENISPEAERELALHAGLLAVDMAESLNRIANALEQK
jgi:hypothetical protein